MNGPVIRLADVLALTDRVQAAITAGEWAAATDLELQRRDLLSRYLEQHRASGVEPPGLDLVALQTTNNRLIGELFHHRRRLVREATTVRTGRHAVRAYGAHSQDADNAAES